MDTQKQTVLQGWATLSMKIRRYANKIPTKWCLRVLSLFITRVTICIGVSVIH